MGWRNLFAVMQRSRLSINQQDSRNEVEIDGIQQAGYQRGWRHCKMSMKTWLSLLIGMPVDYWWIADGLLVGCW
jgi:hypothetical protein